jgi:hypothetical protein
MPRRSPARIAAALALLLGLTGCAPTTLSPMAVRLVPLETGEPTARIGLRTGPRLSVPLSRPEEFRGDEAPFSFPQLGLAYELELLTPLGGQAALHLGVQGEIGCARYLTCPMPVPGYGVSAGLSHYVGNGVFSVAPAVVLRGATDFGLFSEGGPGSILGVEASATFALHEGHTAVGLVPFCGVHRVIGAGRDTTALFFGAVIAGHFSLGGDDSLEVTAGVGRAELRGGPRWTVPLLGVRGGP